MVTRRMTHELLHIDLSVLTPKQRLVVVGIEQDAEYVEIARRRIEHAGAQGRLKV